MPRRHLGPPPLARALVGHGGPRPPGRGAGQVARALRVSPSSQRRVLVRPLSVAPPSPGTLRVAMPAVESGRLSCSRFSTTGDEIREHESGFSDLNLKPAAPPVPGPAGGPQPRPTRSQAGYHDPFQRLRCAALQVLRRRCRQSSLRSALETRTGPLSVAPPATLATSMPAVEPDSENDGRSCPLFSTSRTRFASTSRAACQCPPAPSESGPVSVSASAALSARSAVTFSRRCRLAAGAAAPIDCHPRLQSVRHNPHPRVHATVPLAGPPPAPSL